jgi:hypothetical protein
MQNDIQVEFRLINQKKILNCSMSPMMKILNLSFKKPMKKVLMKKFLMTLLMDNLFTISKLNMELKLINSNKF